ncbi:MAG: hypothetical protein LBB04_03590 [Oscillospiraceae bacterium]|jgi:hypothetical protein|nr:hypothetical protein [Oscillospiraceae bacterium]
MNKGKDSRTEHEREREELFCDLFICKRYRERWKVLLAKKDCRRKLLDKLPGRQDDVLDIKKVYMNFVNAVHVQELEKTIRELTGFDSPKCYILDDGEYELAEGLARVFCHGWGIELEFVALIGNNVAIVVRGSWNCSYLLVDK